MSSSKIKTTQTVNHHITHLVSRNRTAGYFFQLMNSDQSKAGRFKISEYKDYNAKYINLCLYTI